MRCITFVLEQIKDDVRSMRMVDIIEVSIDAERTTLTAQIREAATLVNKAAIAADDDMTILPYCQGCFNSDKHNEDCIHHSCHLCNPAQQDYHLLLGCNTEGHDIATEDTNSGTHPGCQSMGEGRDQAKRAHLQGQ